MEYLIDNNLTDKNTTHSYLKHYQSYFQHLQYDNINILEIGIAGGGSIKLWSDYFINGIVYAIDIIEPPFFLKNYNSDKIKLYKDDAYSTNFIKNEFTDKGIKFDIIIDDGPHTKESYIFVAKHYTNLLTDNGILVIEDVPLAIRGNNNTGPSLEKNWFSDIKFSFPVHLQQKVELIDLRNEINRFDNALIVLKK
jgi:hypothetical protein